MTSKVARNGVQSLKRASSGSATGKQLSPRERDALDYLVKGYSYKEVADQRRISYSTVHTHIEHIYQELHVQA